MHPVQLIEIKLHKSAPEWLPTSPEVDFLASGDGVSMLEAAGRHIADHLNLGFAMFPEFARHLEHLLEKSRLGTIWASSNVFLSFLGD